MSRAVTFLSAHKALAKAFTVRGSKSYPQAKNFSSYTTAYDNIRELGDALKSAASKGHCLLKGHTDAQLKNEPRRGRVSKDQLTDLLVIDLDDIQCPIDLPERLSQTEVLLLAQRLVRYLPEEFHDVSFIAQASSSLGLPGNSKVSMHFFFCLDKEVHPATLQAYLTQINLDSDWFSNQLTLAAAGNALHYPVDRTITQPSRLIYIASPTFGDGVPNPFVDDNDRFALITGDRDHLFLDLDDISISNTDRRVRRRIAELRRAAGLSERRDKVQSITGDDGSSINVIMNPDRVTMTRYADEGSFVRYDCNDGDSHAYWVHKYFPEIVHCFKGEPAFWFEAADPNAYRDHIREFPLDDAEGDVEKHFLFIDRGTSAHYYAKYASKSGTVEDLVLIKQQVVKSFTNEHNIVLVDGAAPIWDLKFRPQSGQVIDIPNQFINRYQMPNFIREPRRIPEAYREIEFGYAREKLAAFCPTIHALVDSVVGNGKEEYEHFVNWLAFIVNERQKTGVAWVLHGTQGTGKGVLFHHVLAPMLGEAHARMMLLDQVMDPFNGWLEENLLLAIDEFSMQGLGSRELSIVNKLKNLITETRGSIRRMHCQSVEAQLYTNILIFSNNLDAAKLQAGDRRFNIAPAQEETLRLSNPALFADDRLISTVKQETAAFAAFLLAFKFNAQAAMTPLENEAKQQMREHSRDTIDDFVAVIEAGQLDEMVEILALDPPMSGEDYVTPAKHIIKAIIRDYKEGMEWKHTMYDLMCLYAAAAKSRQVNVNTFGKMMSHRGLPSQRLRFGGVVRRGYHVMWNLVENDIEVLRRAYCPEGQLSVVSPIAPQEVAE